MVPCWCGLAARSGKMCPNWFLARAGSPPAAERCAQNGSLLVRARRPQRNDVSKLVSCWCPQRNDVRVLGGGQSAAAKIEPFCAHQAAASGQPAPARNHARHIKLLRAAIPHGQTAVLRYQAVGERFWAHQAAVGGSPHRQRTILGTSGRCGRPTYTGKETFCAHQAAAIGRQRTSLGTPDRCILGTSGHCVLPAPASKEPFWAHQTCASVWQQGFSLPSPKSFAHEHT